MGGPLPRQPFMPVEVNLNLHGKSALDPHVDQAEVAIHEVIVKMQAVESMDDEEQHTRKTT